MSKILLFGLSLVAVLSASAQNQNISGTIKDQDGNPLIGANVRIQDKFVGAVTDVNGEFSFPTSEPFPFNSKHLTEIKALFPDSEVKLVDGELYSWYGSRLRFWADQVN